MNSLSTPRSPWPSAGLVLVGPGGVSPGWAGRLSDLVGLRLLEPAFERQVDPQRLLMELAQEQPGWLLPLAVDPGAALPAEGCWAEALAAWRQPALLLLPADQAGAGPDRAYAALLQAAAVPLVGLVQLGGAWQPQSRRRDALVWLGWLPSTADEEAEQRLLLALRARWCLSSARASEPGCPAA